MKKNILITGSTSFLGLHLIEKLSANDNYNIIALTRENSVKKQFLSKYNIDVLEINMSNIEELPNKFDKCIYGVFHFAWEGTRGDSRNNKELQIFNCEQSKKLLKEVGKIGCEIFFTAGSQAEYGLQNDLVDESAKEEPNTEYGISKLNFYRDAVKYCLENDICLIEPRYFSLYGIGDFDGTLIMSCLKKMINNEEINLTKCIQTWNYLNVKDAVNALTILLEKKQSGVYNFGSNDTRELKEFLLEIKKIINSSSKLNFGAIPYTNGVVNVNPNIKKLVKTTKWFPCITFEQGIKDIINNRR